MEDKVHFLALTIARYVPARGVGILWITDSSNTDPATTGIVLTGTDLTGEMGTTTGGSGTATGETTITSTTSTLITIGTIGRTTTSTARLGIGRVGVTNGATDGVAATIGKIHGTITAFIRITIVGTTDLGITGAALGIPLLFGEL
jgi:hypothetical protein